MGYDIDWDGGIRHIHLLTSLPANYSSTAWNHYIESIERIVFTPKFSLRFGILIWIVKKSSLCRYNTIKWKGTRERERERYRCREKEDKREREQDKQ